MAKPLSDELRGLVLAAVIGWALGCTAMAAMAVLILFIMTGPVCP